MKLCNYQGLFHSVTGFRSYEKTVATCMIEEKYCFKSFLICIILSSEYHDMAHHIESFTWYAAKLDNLFRSRHCENFWAFTGPRRDFGLILQILNIDYTHTSFTGATHLLSANVWGPVSFSVSAQGIGNVIVCPKLSLGEDDFLTFIVWHRMLALLPLIYWPLGDVAVMLNMPFSEEITWANVDPDLCKGNICKCIFLKIESDFRIGSDISVTSYYPNECFNQNAWCHIASPGLKELIMSNIWVWIVQ